MVTGVRRSQHSLLGVTRHLLERQSPKRESQEEDNSAEIRTYHYRQKIEMVSRMDDGRLPTVIKVQHWRWENGTFRVGHVSSRVLFSSTVTI